MKTLILLLLMTSVCWASDCKDGSINEIDKNNIHQLACGEPFETVLIKQKDEIKTLQDHVKILAMVYKNLVQLAKLQQEKYEQQQYQLDTLSQTVMERGKK